MTISDVDIQLLENDIPIGEIFAPLRSEILTREVRVLTLGIGILTSMLLFGMYWALLHFGVDIAHAQTMIFISFALYGLVIAYSFRSLRRSIFSISLFDNWALNASVAFGVVLIIATVSIPFLRELFGLTALPLSLALLIIVWLIFNIALVEATKWSFRRFSY